MVTADVQMSDTDTDAEARGLVPDESEESETSQRFKKTFENMHKPLGFRKQDEQETVDGKRSWSAFFWKRMFGGIYVLFVMNFALVYPLLFWYSDGFGIFKGGWAETWCQKAQKSVTYLSMTTYSLMVAAHYVRYHRSWSWGEQSPKWKRGGTNPIIAEVLHKMHDGEVSQAKWSGGALCILYLLALACTIILAHDHGDYWKTVCFYWVPSMLVLYWYAGLWTWSYLIIWIRVSEKMHKLTQETIDAAEKKKFEQVLVIIPEAVDVCTKWISQNHGYFRVWAVGCLFCLFFCSFWLGLRIVGVGIMSQCHEFSQEYTMQAWLLVAYTPMMFTIIVLTLLPAARMSTNCDGFLTALADMSAMMLKSQCENMTEGEGGYAIDVDGLKLKKQMKRCRVMLTFLCSCNSGQGAGATVNGLRITFNMVKALALSAVSVSALFAGSCIHYFEDERFVKFVNSTGGTFAPVLR
mmetsp:Transcript_121141/g.241306  ORF Transcript_121141/g.241306 Transcript_121141/m.241306 type:complete len:466 (+) Transcript_121141:39-1436(+)